MAANGLPAGQLNRRIAVERFSDSGRDALNAPVGAWVQHAEMWAQFEVLLDREKVMAGEAGSADSARFVIRWSDAAQAIEPDMRVRLEGQIWNIKGVRPAPMGLRRFIEIVAVRDSRTGGVV